MVNEMNKIGYCIECNKKVEYYENYESLEVNIKGENILFIGKTARCQNCNEIIFIDEIADYNLLAAKEAYRQQLKLISQREILSIMTKYNIKKRPLSLLLGWGEVTFTRFCDGYIPSKTYSDILLEILYDENKYLDKLEKRKGFITKVAYQKSKQAVVNIFKKKCYSPSELRYDKSLNNISTIVSKNNMKAVFKNMVLAA